MSVFPAVLSGVQLPTRASIVSTFEKILLAIILIEIPIHWDVYLDQQQDEAALGALGGLNVSVTTVCLALLYGTWLPKAAVRRTPLSANVLRAILPATIYAAVVGVAIVGAYSVKLSLFELFCWRRPFCCSSTSSGGSAPSKTSDSSSRSCWRSWSSKA